MTSTVHTATSEDTPALNPERAALFCFPWMASRNFDLFWYFSPILVAIVASILIQTVPNFATGLLFLFIVNAFGVGPAHQGPTWFFYFDKRNREHWSGDQKRLFLYYIAPILVFVGSVLLQVFQPGIGVLVTTLWGIQHLVQQNFGMTMLYHNKNNNEAVPDRKLLHRSLWTPSILFTSIFFIQIFGNGAPMQPWAVGTLSVVGAVALYYVGSYLLNIKKQVAAGARINAPALTFWLVSVIYFVPYIFPGQKLETVALIPGTMHWFQYIGLNIILINHKYAGAERKSDIPCGATVLMAALCIGSAVFFLCNRGVQLSFPTHSLNWSILLGVYFGLANVHYFQDAFFWRFREQFQRDSIMPFLMQARRPGA